MNSNARRISRQYTPKAQARISEDFRRLAGKGKRVSQAQAYDEMSSIRSGITNQTLKRLSDGAIKDFSICQAFVDWIARDIPDYQAMMDREFDCLPEMFRQSESVSPRTPADMVAFDELLKEKSSIYLERLNLVRTRADRDLVRIPISDYAHASIEHAIKATEFLEFLFGEKIASNLSAYEQFVLGVLTYIHDVGMLPLSPQHTPKQMYALHAKQSHLYAHTLEREGLLQKDEADDVGLLCKFHNRPLEEALNAFQASSSNARLDVIFSMFRIGDMLDVELQPGEMLRIHPELIRQTISDVIPKPKDRSITIVKAVDAPSKRFEAWKRYFKDRMDGFNAQLTAIEAEYSITYVDYSTDV